LSASPTALYGGPRLSIALRLLRDAEPPTFVTLSEHRAEPLTQLTCSGCGYGASCRVVPDRCPMCHESAWEYAAWRPFSSRLDA